MKKYFIAVAALAFLAALLETGSEKGGSRTKKI